MNWLVGYTLASAVCAFLAVRIFDYLFAGLVGGFAHAVRVWLHMGIWTAITVSSGMRDFAQRVRRLRQGFLEVSSRIAPPKIGD